ncbi:MAG: tetratricopeptide repeat protein [Gemmatimonadetes bacterium]|nr:tetratricopeptide repeat protein [Gemmatimonadota bacterium]
MNIWRTLIDRLRPSPNAPQNLDYLNEALALERQGDFTAALTSYRLGLRENPNDPRILQNMGIAFTKTGQTAEAIRHYRKALELDGSLTGAHYGLAFLLIKQGDTEKAATHLRAFLARPPKGPDADRWIQHAETVLHRIEAPEARIPAVASL